MGLGQPLLKIIGEINYISGPDAYWEPALATSLNVWKLLLLFFLCPFLDSVRVTFIFSSGVGQLTHWEDEEKWWTQYCFFLWIVKLNSVVAMASSKAAGDVCQVKSPPVGTHPVPVASSVVEFSALLVMGIPGVMGGVLQGGRAVNIVTQLLCGLGRNSNPSIGIRVLTYSDLKALPRLWFEQACLTYLLFCWLHSLLSGVPRMDGDGCRSLYTTPAQGEKSLRLGPNHLKVFLNASAHRNGVCCLWALRACAQETWFKTCSNKENNSGPAEHFPLE